MNNLTLWILTALSSLALATEGSVEIIGRGTVEKAPEFAEVQVKVMSICYEKPVDAQTENAGLARRIQEVMKPYVRTEKDKLVITGGHTLRQSEYSADDNGRSYLLCERKWRTTNTLILQTQDMEAVPYVQQKVIDAMAETDVPEKKQHTYAELMEPVFSVYPETYNVMKKDAQAKAWLDASEQFQVFQNQCHLANVKLAHISQPEYFGLAKSSPVRGENLTPIIPDSVSVMATWKFVWVFDPTVCGSG